MKRHWVKFWPRVLQDRAFMRMPETLRLLAYELILVAGAEDCDDGTLPDVDDINWHLRRDDLGRDLRQLAARWDGLECQDGRWVLVNFDRYQEAPSTKRTRQWRERHGDDTSDGHGDDTSDASRDVPEDRSRRSEGEEEEERKSIGASAPKNGIDHAHPVLSIYKEILHRYPPKQRWAEIVREADRDHRAWRNLLTVWAAKGWNPTNYDGILHRYRCVKAGDNEALNRQEKELNLSLEDFERNAKANAQRHGGSA